MVIEDTAQALGAEYKGRKVGSFGEAGCLSFFPSKTLGAYGDGGMVVTNREELAEKLRVLRMHGGKGKYYHSLPGYNSRLDALQAAILRVKLKYLEEWNEKRRKNAHYYNKLFADMKLILPFEANYGKHIYYLYTIRLKKRDELKKYLESKGISSATYYPLPLHRQEVYRYLGYKEGDFPQAEKASGEVLSLPMYPELDKKEQEEIARVIKEFFK
jgi:dTDP-4-amino-4,6-dideoxygalactose transaminase